MAPGARDQGPYGSAHFEDQIEIEERAGNARHRYLALHRDPGARKRRAPLSVKRPHRIPLHY
jgi:hypothetical protein